MTGIIHTHRPWKSFGRAFARTHKLKAKYLFVGALVACLFVILGIGALHYLTMQPVSGKSKPQVSALTQQAKPTPKPTSKAKSAKPKTSSSVPTQRNVVQPQVAYGTPRVEYGWRFERADNTSACNFNVVVTVRANNWQGYSTGKIKLSITLKSYYATYPFSTVYAMSKGETKVFTQNFSFPTHPSGDNATASVTVAAAGSGLGEAMMINNSLPSDDPSAAWNCF
jgi:hypothetical protein